MRSVIATWVVAMCLAGSFAADVRGAPKKRKHRKHRPLVLDTFFGRLTSKAPLPLPNLHFDYNKAIIKKRSFSTLDKLAGALKRQPIVCLRIEGHITRRMALWSYSRRLSAARARSVLRYLVRRGIARRRLQSIGFGAARPLTRGKTAKQRAQNRRVEIAIHARCTRASGRRP